MTPFLRIPPFPHADPPALAEAEKEASRPNSPGDMPALIEKLKAARVGGDFWGAQPDIPVGAILACPAKAQSARAMQARAAEEGRPVYFWPRQNMDPWHALESASALWIDTPDERALIAALLEKPVHLTGGAPLPPLDALLSQHILDFCYHDPFTGEAISIAAAIDLLAFWRQLIDRNRPIAAAAGIAFWKRKTVEPLLWSGQPIRHIRNERDLAALPPGAAIAVWKTRTAPALLRAIEEGGYHLHEVEDGFIRSVGLGANCVPPLSITVDGIGVHFDPAAPSELENMLNADDVSAEALERAERLRTIIVTSGISKYQGGNTTPLPPRDAGQRHILVTGQVEDDRSIQCGSGGVAGNLDLLRRVRMLEPEAHIIYRPHPDVEAGHRLGAIPDAQALEYADSIDRHTSISTLLDAVDAVHVISSLTGFEALLRGKAVTTHGVPFYAGWGLTRDMGPPVTRRTADVNLPQLIAAVLLSYPRYLDPVTKVPCPPEILLNRLGSDDVLPSETLLTRIRRMSGSLTGGLRKVRARG